MSQFGRAVSTFNSKVRGWNGQINEAKDREEAQPGVREVFERLRSSFTSAESVLSDEASEARNAIDNWDDASVVRSLWAWLMCPTPA